MASQQASKAVLGIVGQAEHREFGHSDTEIENLVTVCSRRVAFQSRSKLVKKHHLFCHVNALLHA